MTQPASREPRSGEDAELDALLAAYFDDRRAAIVNVVAHKASPPEYPGFALVPVADIERLERFLEKPRRLGQRLVWRESMAYESGFEAALASQEPRSGPEPGSGGTAPTFSGQDRTVCVHCGWGVYAHLCPGFEAHGPDIREAPSPDIRVDPETGMAWQQCPRCGQERVPSFNGIRRHDEFCPALSATPRTEASDE